MKTKYFFSHSYDGIYYWISERPIAPEESRHEQISIDMVDFWSTARTPVRELEPCS